MLTVESGAACSCSKAGAGLYQQGEGSAGQFQYSLKMPIKYQGGGKTAGRQRRGACQAEGGGGDEAGEGGEKHHSLLSSRSLFRKPDLSIGWPPDFFFPVR